jgi:diguanylate cyclase (GGDEF)-like protein/PAS domain S-box-containing protein
MFLLMAVSGLLVFAVTRASLWLVPRSGGSPWIWPPGGLALALLISSRRRFWPMMLAVILLASLGARLAAGAAWPVSLAFSLSVCLEGSVAGILLRRISPHPADQPWQLYNFRRFSNFLFFLCVLAGTNILTPSLAIFALGTDPGNTWLRWWVAAVLGSALIVPLVVAWYPGNRLEPGDKVMSGSRLEGVLMFAILGLGSAYLFLNHLDLSLNSDLPAYLIYPFLLLAALRFDQRFVTTALGFVCLVVVTGTLYGVGEFADQRIAIDVGLPAVQHYLLIVITTTMILSAGLLELKMAGNAIAKTEQQYRSLFQNASMGIFHIQPGTGFLRVNSALAAMLGYGSPEEMIAAVANNPTRLYQDGREHERLVDAVIKQDGWSLFVKTYIRKNGSPMTGSISVRKVMGADGNLAYLEGFVEDITERVRAEQALRSNEKLMRLFVENAPAAIAMFDREMRYLVTSQRYRQDYDLGEQDLTGRSHYEVFPEISARWREIHQRCLAGAVEKCEDDPFPRADGRLDYVRWEVRPWFKDENEIGGIILLSEVITGRKLAEQALIKSETLLKETQAMAKVGGWVIDVAARSTTWTREVYRIFGVGDDYDPNDPRVVLEAYAPEDRPLIDDAFNAALKAGVPFDLELRFENAQGKRMWVRTRGTPVVEDGKVVRLNGTIMDITERKRAEAALVHSEEQLRLAMEASSDGMWDWRCQTDHAHYSASYYHMLGYSPEEFPTTFSGMLDMVHSDDQVFTRRVHLDCLENRLQSFEIEFRMRTKAEGWKWILSRGKTVRRDEDGKPLRVVGTTVDITERKQVEEALRRANRKLERQAEANDRMQALLIEQATHDALTGMYNRRYMDDALQRELLRSHRDDYPVSVLMLDIDHFKDFNDTYGHDAGDQVLVALGNLLHTNIRQSDVACRFGGEEFVVILPKAGGDDALNRAERLREDFGNLRIGPEGLSATISIGLAVYPRDGASVDELLRAADQALYTAKAAGRNCVRAWVY